MRFRRFPGAMDDCFEIEVFRPGTFTPMSGAALTFSAEDLSAIADAYDAETAPAPAVVGHPTTDAPAFGWASSFRFDGERQRLVATVGDLEIAFAAAVRAKRYRKVSMAFHKPDAPANPKPGAWYPKHIGFLGGAAPAVSGLQPISFSGKPDEAVVIEFGDAGFRDTASLFRRLRDWMIEQAGIEKADDVLPAYQIEWLSQQADNGPAGFSTPPEKENPVLTHKPIGEAAPQKTPGDAAFAARESQIAERERRIAERERRIAEREAATRHADHESFAEALVKEGRLLPARKAEVVGLLDALAGTDAPVEASFADTGGRAVKEPVLDTLKRLLTAIPKQVDFSALDRSDAPSANAPSFAAPDGYGIDAGALDRHAKAQAYQRQHPGTDWLAAVRAVG